MRARLLVVDDEAEIREALSRHFRYSGFEVQTAGDGLEALQRLQDCRVEVVISDIRMPRMDGVMLLGRLRREYPMMRVIMMTGHVAQEAILACMREGAETCVFKPFEDLSELDRSVAASVASIRMPKVVTVQILDGFLVKVRGHSFVLPLATIRESFRPQPSHVATVAESGEFINRRGKVFPLVRFGEVLSLRGERACPSDSIVVSVDIGAETSAGLLVDEVLGVQQVVLREMVAFRTRTPRFPAAPYWEMDGSRRH